MKTRLTFLCFLLLSIGVHATNISGTISSNMTLDTAGNPWIVTNNVTVNTGVTLTVDSGVVVQFVTGRYLTVNGTLDASDAIFTANSGTPTSGYWNSIRAFGMVDMEDCIIEYANIGIMLYGGAATIESCIINECNTPISYYAPSDFNPSNLTLFNNVNQYIQHTISTVVSGEQYTLPTLSYPYHFITDVTIASGASLTVQKGSILKFNISTGINVEGILKVLGTGNEPVVMTSIRDDNAGGDTNDDGSSTSPATNDWDGIEFRTFSDDAQCQVRFCDIKYAGYSSQAGISCMDASPTIKSCDISNNYYGIKLSGASNPTIDSCTIGSSSSTPIAMDFDANPNFTNNTFSFSDNTYDAIGLLGGTMTTSSTISKRDVTGIPNVTYVMLGPITVDSGVVLTINPGVVIKSLYGNIEIFGTLVADGTASERVVFTSIHDDNYGNPGDTNKNGNSTAPTQNNWGGIVFAPNSSSNSLLDYCVVSYGGTYYYYLNTSTYPYNHYTLRANIAVLKSNPTLSNCETNISDHGIVCYNDAAPTLVNNNIINANSAPIAITADSDPVTSGNSFVNAGLEAMGLIGTEIFANGTISKVDLGGYTNVTYVLIGEHMVINNGAYIDVEPGVVIKSDNPRIIVEGGFKAVGTSAEPIIFTSTKDDNAGNPMDTNGDGNSTTPNYSDWYGIYYDDTSDDNFDSLQYIECRYSSNYGYAYSAAAIHFHSASGVVSNSKISNCNMGIGFSGSSAAQVHGVTIESSNQDPLVMSLSAMPVFSNLTFISNTYNTIGIIDLTLSGNATLSPRTVAGIENIAYRQMNDITINQLVSLTIMPDIVWKSQHRFLKVYGSLNATGNPADRVIFTSIHDDSAGGDSNNNGNATVPDYGQGTSILFYPESDDTNNKLHYCDFRYSGYTSNWTPYFTSSERYGVIKMKNCSVDINQCNFNFISQFALGIYGSANPSITNCEFSNINGTPIHMAMFSDPIFANNTAYNIDYMALHIVGETYSQSATVPIRSFAGYDTVTYYASGLSISNGTTLTIPAGLVFKNQYGGNMFTVSGNIQVDGTMSNPVVFTDLADDDFGSPSDSEFNGPPTNINYYGTYFTFNSVSDDASVIDHAIMRYAYQPVYCNSASPTIRHSLLEKSDYGIKLNGSSTPVVHDNIFNDLKATPLLGSILNYPDTTYSNVLSGTTWKGIGVITETLTQDFTLPKRTFAGQSGIPYVFQGSYTVGTGAILTIDKGVICKFGSPSNTSRLFTVQRGLIVQGGSQPGEQVVFTDISNDFYGGDTNANGDVNSGNGWTGLQFNNESIDVLCQLNNAVVSNASYGIRCTNANPTISKVRIEDNTYGVYTTGSSNPMLDSCSFINNTQYGLYNTGTAFTINAENCYWGDCSGPEHTSNPSGLGDQVTDYVDFDPWSCDVLLPLTGDVSLNGEVQAYDASLILQYLASLISINSQQQAIADVSGEAGITAYDASLILQYNVGLIQAFPVESTNRHVIDNEVSDIVLDLGFHQVSAGEELEIPLNLSNVENLWSADLLIHYNPESIELLEVEFRGPFSDMIKAVNLDNLGEIKILTAGLVALDQDGPIGVLKIKIKESAAGIETIEVKSFTGNESPLTHLAIDGQIRIDGLSGIEEKHEVDENQIMAYPNPFTNRLFIDVPSTNNDKALVRIVDAKGGVMLTQHYELLSGLNTIEFRDFEHFPSGIYFISIHTSQEVRGKMIQHRHK